ncbi:MAG: hypothetical protein C0412_13590, partial [Flavobacterium sp.]|nr:hypothetical protein [Flavobacterium sp.]
MFKKLYFFIYFILFTVVSFSTTRKVPQDYSTIQLAINAAQTGDTVLVSAGTYAGTGNRNITLLGKNVVVKSQNGPMVTIIDCEFQDRAFLVNQGESSSMVIEGFSIRNGNPTSAPLDYGAAIFVAGNSGMTLRSCIIENS